MRLSRDLALKIHYFLDEWVPPRLRDARWFMRLPFLIFYGKRADLFMDFKTLALGMSDADVARFYADTADAPPRRETHLNQACLDTILSSAIGPRVLEVGVGKCHLANKLAERHDVTVADIAISRADIGPGITAVEAPAHRLPFTDQSFDTVICTHTLEHAPDLVRALSELRRVTRRRLIIVVPKQRPYRYTFDPHLHFFPYRFSIELALGAPIGRRDIRLLGGDWFVLEERGVVS